MANTEECTIAWNDISKAFGLNGDVPKDELEQSTIGMYINLLLVSSTAHHK